MKFELTTGLVPFINVNMYNTEISPDNIIEYYTDDESDRDNIYDKFDNNLYTNHILEVSKIFLDKFIEDLKKYPFLSIISAEAVKIYSPRQYNYSGDELYFDIDTRNDISIIYNDFIAYLNKENKSGDFEKYIKEKHKSYDGFISFMPQTMEEFEKEAIGDDADVERTMATIINFIMGIDDTNYQYEFIEYILLNTIPEDFITERIIQTFEKFKNRK